MAVYSREGLTIDVVARTLRKTALNPWLAIPLSAILRSRGPQENPHHMQLVAYVCAAVGIIVAVNDWLNKWSANNWEANGSTDWNWDKEIVVITGGSSGIGASIAQALLGRNPKTAVVIVDYIPLTWTPKKSMEVSYYKCDLSSSDAVRELASQIRSEVGNPTVLVNNAGLCRGSTVMDGSYGDVELTMRTNLIAPFLLVKEFLPHMVKINHGHIINVGSASSLFPPGRVADYAATKAGITALHDALRLELKHIHNAPKVRLTLGILSFIKTPLFKGETRQSQFLFPLMHVDTVGEAFVDALYSGLGGTIYLPGIMRYAATLRGGPEWVIRAVCEGTQSLGVDFRGRQKVNEETGGLA